MFVHQSRILQLAPVMPARLILRLSDCPGAFCQTFQSFSQYSFFLGRPSCELGSWGIEGLLRGGCLVGAGGDDPVQSVQRALAQVQHARGGRQGPQAQPVDERAPAQGGHLPRDPQESLRAVPRRHPSRSHCSRHPTGALISPSRVQGGYLTPHTSKLWPSESLMFVLCERK
jgi:hypothetical protein